LRGGQRWEVVVRGEGPRQLVKRRQHAEDECVGAVGRRPGEVLEEVEVLVRANETFQAVVGVRSVLLRRRVGSVGSKS